ncbi:hypothetical protein T459_27731 [Capsicum annuum]|uniref:Alfin N-terminal domain-containing protein n=1 Tax=Capsicum annuum TaxID=4072 RepID=A0A2G2YES6_CAPAN|nr:hypothetical protein T459_27731 [Capsicum annuum]
MNLAFDLLSGHLHWVVPPLNLNHRNLSSSQLPDVISQYEHRLLYKEKENLCLYGLPNETWEVNLPMEEVPPELSEPTLGTNLVMMQLFSPHKTILMFVLCDKTRTPLQNLEPVLSSQQIWKIIKENKDLDLPAHKVMVATVRCEEIANEKYVSFTENEGQLEEAVKYSFCTGLWKEAQFNSGRLPVRVKTQLSCGIAWLCF